MYVIRDFQNLLQKLGNFVYHAKGKLVWKKCVLKGILTHTNDQIVHIMFRQSAYIFILKGKATEGYQIIGDIGGWGGKEGRRRAHTSL